MATTMYSGYKKKHTVKYEVTVSELNGAPLSVVGPAAGPTSDMSLYRIKVRNILKRNGWIGLADGTYQGDYKYLVVPPRPYRNLTAKQRRFHKRLSKRRIVVENFFARLKNFRCLNIRWRHSILKHKFVFHVLVNCMSIDLEFRPLLSN